MRTLRCLGGGLGLKPPILRHFHVTIFLAGSSQALVVPVNGASAAKYHSMKLPWICSQSHVDTRFDCSRLFQDSSCRIDISRYQDDWNWLKSPETFSRWFLDSNKNGCHVIIHMLYMCTNYWILYGPYYDSKDVCSDSQGSRGCSPPSLPDYICWFIRRSIPKWHYDLYIYTYVFPTEKSKFSASDVSFTRDPVDPLWGRASLFDAAQIQVDFTVATMAFNGRCFVAVDDRLISETGILKFDYTHKSKARCYFQWMCGCHFGF